jgi:hypothetical protein
MQTLIAATLCAAWAIPLPAGAQGQAWGRRPSQSAASIVSSQKLDATAIAALRIDAIRQSLELQAATASKPAEKQKITVEANAAARQAVEDQGLGVAEYQTILQITRDDPSVRQQLRQRIAMLTPQTESEP